MHEAPSAERGQTTQADGRPSLAQRRKTALRLEIAGAAVRLFASQGVTATTGEQIAQAVGISGRTLWRHFPTKESCVLPLFSAGLEFAVEQLGNWPPETGLLDFFTDSCRNGELPPTAPVLLELIRMTSTDPALRAVWLQAHDDALPVLGELLARRSGGNADDLRIKVHAATLNGALRAAAEDFARRFADDPETPDGEIATCLLAALRAASEGLPY
ncbi:TetR/AcrR family transcriptional regulator [Streptomyces sp. NBC_00335]|uniref:TetR/AcrR family transcriptional regulator n=1 Tax=unclassified Streptomyces TaxID=2593676 RepID=UPI0022579BD1|nr:MULTISPECIES: TetR/AcrR family transcriptional regulator [unclassified Streptomyces]MCX5403371.1 TetR/AcrR family transcriptional regulator [Streptomyces sp. NBC_00086]